MQFPHTTKMLIGALLIVLALAAGYYLFFDHIREKNREVSRLTNEIDQLLAQERHAEELRALLIDTEQQRAALDTYFIDSEDLVAFLETVEGLGDAAGVAVTTESVGVVNLEEEGTDPLHEIIRISLTAEGSWSRLYHFFSFLEVLPYAVTFEKANFEEGEDQGGGQWTGAFVFTVAKLK